MSEFETWVYRGVIAVLAIILWYLLQNGFYNISKTLKEMLEEIRALNTLIARHDEKILSIHSEIDKMQMQLNDHSEKIRDIERIQDQCKSCKK